MCIVNLLPMSLVAQWGVKCSSRVISLEPPNQPARYSSPVAEG
jgi:hypothetical protein